MNDRIKQLIDKWRPLAEKIMPASPAVKTLLPVLVTGLILLGCAQAPVLKAIPERLSLTEDEAAQAARNEAAANGQLNSGLRDLVTGTSGNSSGASGTASAGNAAASRQVAYTAPANGYKDGTYTGTAQGYGGPVTVQVTISGGKITAIAVTSAAKEDTAFLNKAKGVISKIISAQSPNVDAVSGATYSSNGIINAVKNALSKAANSSSVNTGGTTTTNTSGGTSASDNTGGSGTTQTDVVVPDDAKFADGVYTGSAQGFGGEVKMEVTIKDGVMSAVRILSASNETPEYLAMAEKLADTILAAKSADVDIVSGATYTSKGIINGVKAALVKAANAKSSGGQTDDSGSDSGNTSDNNNKDDSGDSGGSGTNDNPSVNPSGAWQDGVYTGEGAGYGKTVGDGGDIEVRVTISGGVITDITVVSAEGETPQFLNMTSRVIDSMLEKQSTDVDVVTGATLTSNGIINGVKEALQKAVSGESDEPSDQPDTGGDNNDPGTDDPSDQPGAGDNNDSGTTDPSDDPGTGGSDDPGTATDPSDHPEPGDNDDPGTTDPSDDPGTGGSDPAASGPVYEDGDYTGSAQGWGGTITMNVTIMNGEMFAIELGSANSETPGFLNMALDVIDRMLEAQSADVDTVTGATYTSRGIINAVKDALSKADTSASESHTDQNETSDTSGGSSESSGGSTGTAGGSGQETSGESTQSSYPYADGNYTGTAFGYAGNITMQVTFKDGIMKAIDVISAESETPAYMKQATDFVVQHILAAQSTDVDVLTGATYSSEGIINAVSKAMQKAAAAAGGN